MRKPVVKIARIDNDGNYEPENVRWETVTQQQRNTRRTRLLTFDGRTQSMADWADEVGLPYATLNQRINGYEWSVEKALTTPKLSAGGKRVA